MSVFDLISLVVENLARRKGRVALTAVGVVILVVGRSNFIGIKSCLDKNFQ